MPKVSIVVPIYNVEQYLHTALDSLIRQTLKDIEIICVNDGSGDGSKQIIEEYAKNDIRVIQINQENGGYGKAMNAGIDRASGEYLGILEPDDYVSLTMYEDLYETAKNYHLDFVKADYKRFTTDKKTDCETYKYIHLSEKQEDYGRVFRPTEYLESFLFVMNTWSGIYRLDYIRENRIRHNETPGASFQDNGFWFQTFLCANRAMIVNKPYYNVRRDNPNSSIYNPGKIYAMNREYDYIRGILLEKQDVWDKMKGVYWRTRFRNYLATINRIDAKYEKEYVNTINRELKEGLLNQEYSSDDFPVDEWKILQSIIEGSFNIQDIAKKKDIDELELLKQSTSYKLGRILTFIPRKILCIIKSKNKDSIE